MNNIAEKFQVIFKRQVLIHSEDNSTFGFLKNSLFCRSQIKFRPFFLRRNGFVRNQIGREALSRTWGRWSATKAFK